MPDLSQFSPLFVDCLFNREIVGRFEVQQSLSCSDIRLCVCFADFERIKVLYNLYLKVFLFQDILCMYFFYLIQFRNRLYMYVVLRRNRLNRNLRWLSTMEYAISLARSRKKIEEENLQIDQLLKLSKLGENCQFVAYNAIKGDDYLTGDSSEGGKSS